MFEKTSKYFSFFNNKPPASWVVHITKDFLTCYSCLYCGSMVQQCKQNFRKVVKNGALCDISHWVKNISLRVTQNVIMDMISLT